MGQTENLGRLKWKPIAPSYERTCVQCYFLILRHFSFYQLLVTLVNRLSPFFWRFNSPSTAAHGASLCIRIKMTAYSILPRIRRYDNRLSLVIFLFCNETTKSIPFNWYNNRNKGEKLAKTSIETKNRRHKNCERNN